jgi:hypothetical protein
MKLRISQIAFAGALGMLYVSGLVVQASARQLSQAASLRPGACCTDYICQSSTGCTTPGCPTCNTKVDECGIRGTD